MRYLVLAGVSFLSLVAPARAQLAAVNTSTDAQVSADAGVQIEPTSEEPILPGEVQEIPAGNAIDTVVQDALQEEQPRPTGDALIDRLNAMDARIQQLEARNAELEQQAELSQGRLESVENRAAKNVQFSWAPTLSDPNANFTFKPRGVIEADYAAFFEGKGRYDYNNGTAFRRARLGVEGTAFKVFNYRLEADFAGNAVSITDAYLQYTKIPKTVLTVGQHKAPFGLESNNSDNYNVFLERGMFTNAFGNAGAERRIGISVAHSPAENLNLAIGLFGDNESVFRSASSPVTDTPDESWGVNGRVAWEPIFEAGKILHVGASAYYRRSLRAGDIANATRLTDRPNVRVDNGNIADTGVISEVHSLRYLGGELAGVFGPLTIAGEYGRLWLDRTSVSDEAFDGFYGYASYFITGETRPFKGGNFDRVKPFRELGNDGLGAFEVAARFDKLNLSNTPVLTRAGNRAQSITLGVNWYFNPYAKVLLNWIHFNGRNTPLDPVGTKTAGDTVAARLHLDF